ncbi:MAG: hypothetical protein J6Q85_01350 [Clostridia bacterium]|nr:hypothetical protein [Clostridia bacterium]
MKFLKDNSYDIVRLLINQIGITIFSFALMAAIGAIEDPSTYSTVLIAASVFATGFYLVLIYTVGWECGAKDKIRIDGGRLAPKRYKGALMSLIANIPNFILTLAAIICMALYMSSGDEGLYSAFALFNLFFRFIEAMYLGIIQAVFSGFSYDANLQYLLESVGFFVAPILAIFATHLGYYLGSKNLRLLSLIQGKRTGEE